MKSFQQYLLEMEGEAIEVKVDDIEPTDRVRQALRNLKEIDSGYYYKVFRQRSLKDSMAAGSVYDMSPDELESKILSAEWDHYSHPSIKPEAEGFVTYDLTGRLGIIDLMKALRSKEIDNNDKITFSDPKNTGRPYPTIAGKRGEATDITVAILGKYPNTDKEVLFTFHPGEPVDTGIDDSDFPAEWIGTTMTVGEALDKGVKMAKVV